MDRILLAKKSVVNRCLCPDDTLLVVRGQILQKIVRRDRSVRHHFTSADDGMTTSRYGWIAKVHPFSFDDFMERVTARSKMSDSDIQLTKSALTQLSSFPEGAPVACEFTERGIIHKEVVFHVHRVVFKK